MRYPTVIFDLDGTLLDTRPGVLGCFAKAEQELGIPPLPPEERNWVLGPSLYDSFTIKYGLSHERATEAVACYRRHYDAGGVTDCAPFVGVRELLDELKAAGVHLRVATTKMHPFALRALRSQGLLDYFELVSAPTEKDHGSGKKELVERAAEGAEGPCLMVGDRSFDIDGARACGLDSVYVLYGFGNKEEAALCRPSYVAEDCCQLRSLLLGRGCFISFEGGDGVGKTTQIENVRRYLTERGYTVRLTREPGGTPAAERVRELLLDPHLTIDPVAEAYLYAASRAEHVRGVLRPAILRGEAVLCDRYLDSSIAYQGYGRQLGGGEVRALNAWAVDGLLPDRTYLLTLDGKEAERRVGARSARDRLELEGDEFRQRVRQGFGAAAQMAPERVRTILATGSESEVFERIREDLDSFLGAL